MQLLLHVMEIFPLPSFLGCAGHSHVHLRDSHNGRCCSVLEYECGVVSGMLVFNSDNSAIGVKGILGLGHHISVHWPVVLRIDHVSLECRAGQSSVQPVSPW